MSSTSQRDKFRLHFPKDLVVTPLRDAKYWRAVKEFEYLATKENGRIQIIVATDFATDFASVPIPFRWWIPKWGKYGWAAVIHDWLYTEQMYCKEFADDIFHEAMLISGVHPLLSKLMYLAVSWLGLPAWLSAEAKIKLGKTKRSGSGSDSRPDWDISIGQQLGGIRQGWKQRRIMWKARNQ